MLAKKLYVVSLLGSPRTEVVAAYDGEVLVVQKMEPIAGMFNRWKKPLLERIRQYQNLGFTVLVEERTDHFSEDAHRLLLDEVDEQSGRTWQNVALDLYFSLIRLGDQSGNQRGNLVLHKSIQQYFLSENLINVSQDERGRNRYDIEAEGLKGWHRALLLTVLAALEINPMTDDYLDQFFAALDQSSFTKPTSSLEAITIGVDRSRANEWTN